MKLYGTTGSAPPAKSGATTGTTDSTTTHGNQAELDGLTGVDSSDTPTLDALAEGEANAVDIAADAGVEFWANQDDDYMHLTHAGATIDVDLGSLLWSSRIGMTRYGKYDTVEDGSPINNEANKAIETEVASSLLLQGGGFSGGVEAELRRLELMALESQPEGLDTEQDYATGRLVAGYESPGLSVSAAGLPTALGGGSVGNTNLVELSAEATPFQLGSSDVNVGASLGLGGAPGTTHDLSVGVTTPEGLGLSLHHGTIPHPAVEGETLSRTALGLDLAMTPEAIEAGSSIAPNPLGFSVLPGDQGGSSFDYGVELGAGAQTSGEGEASQVLRGRGTLGAHVGAFTGSFSYGEQRTEDWLNKNHEYRLDYDPMDELGFTATYGRHAWTAPETAEHWADAIEGGARRVSDPSATAGYEDCLRLGARAQVGDLGAYAYTPGLWSDNSNTWQRNDWIGGVTWSPTEALTLGAEAQVGGNRDDVFKAYVDLALGEGKFLELQGGLMPAYGASPDVEPRVGFMLGQRFGGSL